MFQVINLNFLRILASDEPKISKNEKLLDVLPHNFVNTASFKNLNDTFLVNGPCMKMVIWKARSGGRAEIEHPNVCKFFTFSVSAQPLEGIYQILNSSHFANWFVYCENLSNITVPFSSMGHWPKKCHSDFWKMKQNVQKVLISGSSLV